MYDYKRGEHRAKIGDRNKVIAGKATLADLGLPDNADFGDCIECTQCVKVCPMGIDIRNGTQLECVHCTACIDACDAVMDKIDKPRGLIRYASENSIRNETKKILTPRVAGYTAVLVILLTIFATLMTMRTDLETTILRQPGTLYQELPNDVYSNIYQIKVINKTFDTRDFELRLLEPSGEMVSLGSITSVEPQNLSEGRFLIKLDKAQLSGLKTTLKFGVFSNNEQIETLTSGFIGPAK
jgi:cytochrome c oxidase accessory protein FixG